MEDYKIEFWNTIDYETPFTDAIIWDRHVAMGFSEYFTLINLEDHSHNEIRLRGYFGYLYPYDSFLLVATQFNLICINKQGLQVWETEMLGIDGVIVHDFDGGNIYGSGENDPPGGWIDFIIDSRTGKRLGEEKYQS